MVSFVTCFVQMSPGFSVPGCLNNLMTLFRILSWTHNCPVARWRTLPIPVRLQMPMAALKSVLICTTIFAPKSSAKLCSPKASLAPFTMPCSSASPEDNARVFWVVAQCLTRCEPYKRHPPEVLLRVSRQPAKSVSTKAVMAPSHCQGNR